MFSENVVKILKIYFIPGLNCILLSISLRLAYFISKFELLKERMKKAHFDKQDLGWIEWESSMEMFKIAKDRIYGVKEVFIALTVISFNLVFNCNLKLLRFIVDTPKLSRNFHQT